MSNDVKDQICDEIVEIMRVYDEQSAAGNLGTPGGLEHMGDVWQILRTWRDRIKAAQPEEL